MTNTDETDETDRNEHYWTIEFRVYNIRMYYGGRSVCINLFLFRDGLTMGMQKPLVVLYPWEC